MSYPIIIISDKKIIFKTLYLKNKLVLIVCGGFGLFNILRINMHFKGL